MTSSDPDLSSRLGHGPGAHVHPGGVSYWVWAPDHRSLSVRVHRGGGEEMVRTMERDDEAYFRLEDEQGRAGDRYRFVLPDGRELPDPASRYQPEGVHGWSECVDAQAYRWLSDTWRRPGWRGQTIYELHVGTFTPEGTFRAAIARLDHVRALGAEAIELMPVADFPGGRNWGYDGVALFAPARCYGRPDDLRALVDAAHERGLAVILDVVYNHLGPDGNYLGSYAQAYFDPDRHTPWGQGFHLSGPHSRPVREFFLSNASYWLDAFRFDGLRLDATHAIEDDSPRHLLAEIADAAHARGAFLIAEDDRNSCEVLGATDGNGCGIDAAWADDFHHEVRVALTGTRESYFKSYGGSAAELGRTLEHGWFYTGQPYPQWKGRPRGEPCAHLPAKAFVYCIENHDQVGNRAKGERLEHLIGAEAFRAASLLLCLSPYAPMIFMGQEWAASSPFLFFTDHAGELGHKVSEGRRKEFAAAGLNEGLAPKDVPDPQAPETFERSKLDWREAAQDGHAEVAALYREGLRHRAAWLREAARERAHWSVVALERAIAIRYAAPGRPVRLVLSSLWGRASVALVGDERLGAPGGTEWRVELDSRAGPARSVGATLAFEEPGTVLLAACRPEVNA